MSVSINKEKIKLLSGEWGDNLSWEFYLDKELPQRDLCTAVFCVAIYGGQIVLTKTHRGWELPGGHIEEGESVEDALKREAYEEGGVRIDGFELFGYRKITARNQALAIPGSRSYPFPVSYIPYFLVTTDTAPVKVTGAEVIASRLFRIEDIDNSINTEALDVIKLGLQQYLGSIPLTVK